MALEIPLKQENMHEYAWSLVFLCMKLSISLLFENLDFADKYVSDQSQVDVYIVLFFTRCSSCMNLCSVEYNYLMTTGFLSGSHRVIVVIESTIIRPVVQIGPQFCIIWGFNNDIIIYH